MECEKPSALPAARCGPALSIGGPAGRSTATHSPPMTVLNRCKWRRSSPRIGQQVRFVRLQKQGPLSINARARGDWSGWSSQVTDDHIGIKSDHAAVAPRSAPLYPSLQAISVHLFAAILRTHPRAASWRRPVRASRERHRPFPRPEVASRHPSPDFGEWPSEESPVPWSRWSSQAVRSLACAQNPRW